METIGQMANECLVSLGCENGVESEKGCKENDASADYQAWCELVIKDEKTVTKLKRCRIKVKHRIKKCWTTKKTTGPFGVKY